MQVEIWSDFVCPFCYIGKRRFEAAVSQFEGQEEIEVIYRSFELDPRAKRDNNTDIHNLLASKYGMSREEAKAMNENVGNQAKEIGLTYHFDTMIPTNTFDAHRLMHFAKQQEKLSDMTERLLKAYFTDSENISDHNTLAKLAAEVGLDQQESLAMLASDEYTQAVHADVEEGQKLGIQGVPFFVINRKYAVSGAQPTEVFLSALEKAWSEEKPLTILSDSPKGSTDASSCDDTTCNVPTNN